MAIAYPISLLEAFNTVRPFLLESDGLASISKSDKERPTLGTPVRRKNSQERCNHLNCSARKWNEGNYDNYEMEKRANSSYFFSSDIC